MLHGLHGNQTHDDFHTQQVCTYILEMIHIIILLRMIHFL